MVAVPDRLIITNQLSQLRRIAEWVRTWSLQHEVPSRTADLLDLFSTELVTNVVTYGYDDNRPHDISLRLRRGTADVTLEIEDDGIPFDPQGIEEPRFPTSLDEAKAGGLGIHLVRTLSDELRHQRLGGRNHLKILLRFPPP